MLLKVRPQTRLYATISYKLCQADKPPESKDREYPEEPTTCCMSGCQNCVWLEYAEKLSKYYQDQGEAALKEIEEKVKDPSMKAFLLHELRMKKNQKV